MITKDNIHDLTIIKRNNTEIKIGYGILTKNPLQMSHNDKKWCKYRQLVWIFYDGDWYIVTKIEIKTILDCINFIHSHPTYSKEQLFDLIYDLCK